MNSASQRQSNSGDTRESSDSSTWSEEAIRRHACCHLLTRRPAIGFDVTGWRLLLETGLFFVGETKTPSIRIPAMRMRAAGSGGADRGLMFAAGAHYFGCMVPIARHGTVEQKQQWLPAMQIGQQIG